MQSRVTALHSLRSVLEHACRPFELSHQRYDETHELFEQSSNQQRRIIKWLLDLISSDYASVQRLKILSVGCGSGIMDVPLIKSIAQTSNQVEYTGVDPNELACRRFQDDFDDQELPNVQLDLREQDIESLISTDRFDVIHLVHSLYYFDDPADTLDGLLKLLAPEGKVLIVQAPEAELNQLAKCFWTHHEEHGIWFSDCLAGHLSERGLAFSRQRIDGEVDVTRCFEADCPRGEMILDFITQSDCQQLDDDVVQLCLGYLAPSVVRKKTACSLLILPTPSSFRVHLRQVECLNRSPPNKPDRSPRGNPLTATGVTEQESSISWCSCLYGLLSEILPLHSVTDACSHR